MATLGREALQRRWTDHDGDAFQTIVRTHGSMVYRTCARILGNASDAEEVAQECFEILARAACLPDEVVLGSWLHGIATNRSLMRLRSDRRRVAREARYALGQPRTTVSVWDDVSQHIDEAIAALPDELRIPLVRHFFGGESHRVLGRALGVSHRTVGLRIQRGLHQVREHLKRKDIVVGSSALAAMLAPNMAVGASVPPVFAVVQWVGRSIGGWARAAIARHARRATNKGVAVLSKFVVSSIAIATIFGGHSSFWTGDLPNSLEHDARTRDGSDTSMDAAPGGIAQTTGVPMKAMSEVEVIGPEFEDQDAELGRSGTLIGDVTGDGIQDIALGAPRASRGQGYDAAGRVLIVDGASGKRHRVLDTPSPEPRCNVVDCNGSGSFGISLAVLQDINHNGYVEMAMGAQSEKVDTFLAAGHVYIIDTFSGEVLRTLVTPNLQSYACFGAALATVPDVNGDEVDEIAVGAEQESPHGKNAAGRAYLVDGASGAFLRTLESPDVGTCHVFGTTLAGLPDINGDGAGDVVVGQGSMGVGGAHVFSGGTGELLWSLRSPSDQKNGGFGTRVLSIPDRDGDGTGEVMVGALAESVDMVGSIGRVYIFGGGTGALLDTIEPPDHGGCRYFGACMSVHDDFTGDGVPDYMIGTEGHDSEPIVVGVVVLVDGATLTSVATLASPSGTVDSSFAAYRVLQVPDRNHDGINEIMVTSPSEGMTYVFHSPFVIQEEDGGILSLGRHEDVVGTSGPDIAKSESRSGSRSDSAHQSPGSTAHEGGRWRTMVERARRVIRQCFLGGGRNAQSSTRSDQTDADDDSGAVGRAADFLSCRPYR